MEENKSYKKSKSIHWNRRPLYISSSIFFIFVLFSLLIIYLVDKNNNDLVFLCISLLFSLIMVNILLLKITSKLSYVSLFFNIKYIFNKKICIKFFTYFLILAFYIVNFLSIFIIYKISLSYNISNVLSKYFYLVNFIISLSSSIVVFLYFIIYKKAIIKNKYIDNGITTFSGPEHSENNSHLVLKEKKAILIDGGNNTKTIIEYIKANNIQITHVLVTHFHYDHWIGLNDLYDFDNEVLFLMNKVTYEWLYSGNDINKKYLLYLKNEKNVELLPKLKIEIIEDNGILNINDIEIKYSLIKGHTPDSTFYLIESLNSIFVGDTIFYDDVGFHFFEYTNIEEFKNSILYIQNYSTNIIVYPGHHKIFTSRKSKQWSLIDKIKI